MELSSIVILAIVAFISYKLFKKYISTPSNEPPSVGILNPFKLLDINTRHKVMTEISEKYNTGIFTVNGNVIKFIVINEWKIMKEALVTQSDVFSGRPSIYVLDALGAKSDIVTADGPMWKEKRRFTMHQLRNLGFGKSSMEVHIQNEISRFLRKLEKDDGQEIKINELIQMPVLNILWGIISGKTYDYEDEGMKQLVHLINSNFTLLMKTLPISIFPPLRHLPFDPFCVDKLVKELSLKNDFFMNEIEEHVRTFQEGDIRDFIDSYVERILQEEKEGNKNGDKKTCFERRHLVGIMENLFSAGVETTATTMEWAFMYMALWPEIQEKVQKELDSVVGRHRQPCLSDRPALPYIDATIMEVQRFSTVIAISYHRPMVDAIVFGYSIPKTSLIMRNIWAVHNDKSLWGDPEVFRPERFINAEGKAEKSEYLIPFSTGARNCLGEPFARMQLFLFFTCFMQRFTFSVPMGKPPPSLEPVVTLTQNPKPFSLVIKSR